MTVGLTGACDSVRWRWVLPDAVRGSVTQREMCYAADSLAGCPAVTLECLTRDRLESSSSTTSIGGLSIKA